MRSTFFVEPPPSNSDASHASTIVFASSGPITRAPIVMICASLLLRARSAEYVSWHVAARIPGTLFAVIAMPMPVPHMRMPRSCFPSAIASATFTAMSG